MTSKRFIEKAEGYYAEYTTEQRGVVYGWLEQRTDRERDVIYAEVLKILSATYRTPPGIKELEEAWTKAVNYRRGELGPAQVPDVPQIASETSEEYCTEEEAEHYFAELKKRMRGISRKWKAASDG